MPQAAIAAHRGSGRKTIAHELGYPTWVFTWTVYDRLASAESPYEVEFASKFSSIAAGAIGEFERKYPRLSVIRSTQTQQVGEFVPF